MYQEKYFIFDMDGTLYKFDKGKSNSFTASAPYLILKQNAFNFLSQRLGISLAEASEEYERIKEKYAGEVSIGLEKEYGIDRYEFFNKTWTMDPADHIEFDETPSIVFSMLKGRVAVLTGAPRIWAEKVLKYLGVYDYVENSLFTGEPDLRKPKPEVFAKIADFFGVPPEQIYSIGDQEEFDLVPAKVVGMKTVLVGKESNNADICVPSIKDFLKMLESGELK